MKRNSMISYLEYLAVKVIGIFFRLLPLRVALWVGRRMGDINYLINNKRRRIAYSNLKAAFSKEKPPGELLRITKGVFRNLGETAVEVLRFPKLSKKNIDELVRIEGLQGLEEALAKGKGVVVLTAHFGNWELASLAMAAKGYPPTIIAKEQHHTRLNELLNLYRESTGSKIVTRGMAVREAVKALGANQLVAILADQDAKSGGCLVKFFNRTTTARQGAISLALRTGCEALPGLMIREGKGRHRVVFEKGLELERSGDEAGDVQAGVQRFTTLLEGYVRQYPEQWLWVHRRWKSSPNRSILILSDGKPGHLGQSLAAVQGINGRWQADDGKWRDCRTKVLEIKYKNRFFRGLLPFLALFSSSRCQGCLRCLRICLKRSSYKELESQFADLIVSCGSALAPLNLVVSRENMAKSVVIMKPSPFSTRRFDLAIIPKHDRPPKRDNVLATTASPNLICEEYMTKGIESLKEHLKLKKDLRIALFIGGNTAGLCLSSEKVEEVLDNIIRAAEDLDAEILVTTSRRTSEEIENLLKSRLSRLARCKLLIIARESNIDHAVGGMLGLAEIAIVSEDSVSMISEAASSGKYTIVFELDRVGRATPKYSRFLDQLRRDGYVVVATSSQLFDRISTLWLKKPPIKILDDNRTVRKAVKGLL